MTGLEAVWRSRSRPQGLSEFEPRRDLGAVVNLLHLGFGAEMAENDKQWLRDLAALSNAGPWLTIMALLFPPALQGLTGFVWHEEGELVANASLMRGRGDTWVVANVVTRPEYRRQGISRELMKAVTSCARQRGSRQLQLQVRDDNEAAQQLYARLGYVAQGARTLLRLPSSTDLPLDRDVELPAGVGPDDVVGWGADEADAARRMLRRAGLLSGGGPPGQVRQALARVGWRGSLQDLMHGRKTLRWAIQHRGHFIGLGAARLSAGSGPHQAELATDPPWRDRAAPLLVSSMTAVLSGQVEAPLEVDVDVQEDAVIGELLRIGFERRRTLELMVHDLE